MTRTRVPFRPGCFALQSTTPRTGSRVTSAGNAGSTDRSPLETALILTPLGIATILTARFSERVLKALVTSGQADTADTFGWVVLTEKLEGLPPAKAKELLLAVSSGLPGSDDVREQIAGHFRTHYADHPHFQEILDASGLMGDQSPRRAVRTLLTCLSVEPGGYRP